MAKFRIVTPAGASFTVAGGGYATEMAQLVGIDAEIIEVPADSEDEFIKHARNADAIYAKAIRFTKKIIDSLEKCQVIVLGSVGVDSVDVAAATERGIPVTNVPHTFIEEVADHTMALLLAGFRRLVEQDQMVRTGRWREGRPALLKIPRLMGQTLGFISFGHVPRAVAVRARPFGLRMLGYDPYHRGADDEPVRRPAVDARGGARAVGFRLDARAGDAGGARACSRSTISAR